MDVTREHNLREVLPSLRRLVIRCRFVGDIFFWKATVLWQEHGRGELSLSASHGQSYVSATSVLLH